MVSLDLKRYWVSSQLVGHHLLLHLDGKARCLQGISEQQVVTSWPLKGMVGQVLSSEPFLTPMLHQAPAQARLRSLQERTDPTAAFTARLSLRGAGLRPLTMWEIHTRRAIDGLARCQEEELDTAINGSADAVMLFNKLTRI